MSVAAYPTQEDLNGYIQSLGVINPARLTDALALMRTDRKAAAAWQEWEKRTGYKPFLGETSDSTRYLDPPGPNNPGGGSRLYLPWGLVSLTSLKVYCDPADATTGTALTANTDFFLMDAAGDYIDPEDDGRPYELIEFRTRLWGGRKSIRLVGKRGYAAEIGEDVWEAIRQYGGYLCYQELSLNISRGLFSRRDVNSEVRYGGGGVVPLSGEVTRWDSDFRAKARQYSKVEV